MTVTHIHIGLDDDTHRQLNRIEVMLTAVCEVKGINPDALPGYDRRHSPSQSSRSPSSTRSPLERQHLSDAIPELPHNAGMAPYSYIEYNMLNQLLRNASQARASGAARDVQALVQAQITRVDHPWAGFKVEKLISHIVIV